MRESCICFAVVQSSGRANRTKNVISSVQLPPISYGPIGIGEVLHRIIGKCVMMILKLDVEECAGGLQSCGGQKAIIEAAIHTMHELYRTDQCEGMLLVDAINNTFYSLNHKSGHPKHLNLMP